MRGKHGAELTLNTIIIAALVLLLLVVLVMIIVGFFGDTVPQFGNFVTCQGRGGQCYQQCQVGEQKLWRFGGCGGEDYLGADYCCIPPENPA